MNIAIIIGISDYLAESKIIAPQQDAARIQKLLDATEKYDESLYIIEQTAAFNIKARIRDFLLSYSEEDIEEVFYYFSGHGKRDEQEFYMLCSDYEKSKLTTTSLQNSEIDNFIRTLKPKLTVKVVDACFSGSRYVKDDPLNSSNNGYSQNTLGNVIFMSSSHDNQTSEMMQDVSFFTEKFIEGALSLNIGNQVRYRDIKGFIADEFNSMDKQKPFFTEQGTGTEIFAEYTDKMQALKDKWYSQDREQITAELLSQQGHDENNSEIALSNEEIFATKIEQLLEQQDTLFVEENEINSTLENIKKTILDYQIKDSVVSKFYKTNLSLDKKLSALAKSSDLLEMADIEDWSKEYLIQIHKKTVRVPVSNRYRESTGMLNLQSQLFGFQPDDTREVQKPTSLKALHSLPYEVVWVEFQPINKLSLAPLVAIIALVHSETRILTLRYQGMMIKDSWRHFAVDWDSLRWDRQEFLWKDIIENPNQLWEEFLNQTVKYLRNDLLRMLPKNTFS